MTAAEARELLASCKRQRDVWRIAGMPPSPEAVARVERDEATAHAVIVEDYDREHAARVAAEAEADGLRRDLATAEAERDLYRAALADAASGEAWKCDTHHGGTLATQVHADGDAACDACAAGDGWTDTPHAAAIRGALKATEGER